MNEVELVRLKQRIEDAKASTAELKGQQNALMKQLKNDWKCDSVAEAEKLMAKMEKELDALNKQIETGLKELEEKYNA